MSEKVYKNKCDKCKKEIEAYSTIFKGANDTKLCKRCGANACFICGKKETKKEWIEDVGLLRKQKNGRDWKGNVRSMRKATRQS